MIKLTDYLSSYLSNIGVKDVFMISGGGAMHLVDSIGKNKKLRYLCPHHEQAAAIAAEGYARASGKMGVVVVTSGPGGTNTLTGVIGQWLDSVPCLYLSGQVKFETTIASCPELGLRQLGDQEINIVDIVKPVTKYAVMVTDPKTIRYHLEKAIHLAEQGRPGPVWLDIPLDVQGAMIDESTLKGYEDQERTADLSSAELREKVSKVIALLKKSKRPVLVAGNGIRISGGQSLLMKLLKMLRIPVIPTFNGFDLIPTDYPLYVGRIGTLGTRAGNFALQNSDLVLMIGTRNNIRQSSYNWKDLARSAAKIVVDIDPAELKKPTVKPDIAICADASDFIMEFSGQLGGKVYKDWDGWLEWCIERKVKYPVILPEYSKKARPVNPYLFIDELTARMPKGAIMVAGDGTACVVPFQAGHVKKGQRIFWNSGCASMGYDLPASIGACLASGNKQVICLTGDGSLQMNIQELQTVISKKLPIKIFVLNNSGYASIRQTQDTFFNGRHVACDPKSGVTFPDIIKVAKAYGFSTYRIDSHGGMKRKIDTILKHKGSAVCEVTLDPNQKFSPRVSSEKRPDGKIVSKAIDDMFPFLGRDEYKSNKIVDIIASKGRKK
jgi:acetolactate synthase-1/2/3 large subunit